MLSNREKKNQKKKNAASTAPAGFQLLLCIKEPIISRGSLYDLFKVKRSSDNKKKIVQAQQHTYIVECVRAVGAQNQIIRGNCKHFAQRKSSSSTYQRLVQM